MLEHAQETSESTPRDLYRIGEVSRLTQTKAFVLRYWETEFPMLQPVKTPKGHRLYRSEDIEMVRAIKRLLYDEGFTIAGARRHLADHGNAVATFPARDNGHSDSSAGNGAGQFHEAHAAASGDTSGANGATHLKAELPPAGLPPAERHVLRELRMELAAILTLLTGQ